MKKYVFGVDVGGTTVKMGLFEGDGNVIDKWEIKTVVANGGEAILPDIAASIAEKLVEHGVAKEDVVGVGVGVPAPVSDEGVVKQTANLGWGYKEVRRELEELTGLNAVIGNDANVAALGEMWQGGGRIRFGIYACSPEDSSFKATFTHMEMIECKWLPHDGQQPDKE